MHKLGYKNYFKVVLRWLWLAASFQKARVHRIEIDQEILFEGATCRLLWKISGACMVRVYCNGQITGTFLPSESPYIPLSPNVVIQIKAVGAYRNRSEKIKPNVSALTYHPGPALVLNQPVLRQPHVVKSLQPKISAPYPVNQHPVIRLPEISMEIPRIQRSEQELFARLENAITETDNQTLISYYGNIIL